MNIASITPNFQHMQFGVVPPSSSSPLRVQEYHDLFRHSGNQPMTDLTPRKHPQQLYLAIQSPPARDAFSTSSFAAWPRQTPTLSGYTAATAAQSTPNSYTGDFYTADESQQTMVRVPQSAIQSALNQLTYTTHELGIAAPSLVAPRLPPSQLTNHKIAATVVSPTKDDNSSHTSSASTCDPGVAVAMDSHLFVPSDSVHHTTTNHHHHLSPQAPFPSNSGTNGGGGADPTADQYRQTLNPAIYNSYRTSSPPRSNASDGNKGNKPVVHVIAETVYRVPQDADGSRSGYRKQDRFDKTSLYKTELCTNWMLTGACTYGNKCHFAHGVEDLKPRMRVENYKTQPCCDPAREGCRRCMYGRRCNYCHPGEAIRRPHPTPYYDRDYYGALQKNFGKENDFPFGIYV